VCFRAVVGLDGGAEMKIALQAREKAKQTWRYGSSPLPPSLSWKVGEKPNGLSLPRTVIPSFVPPLVDFCFATEVLVQTAQPSAHLSEVIVHFPHVFSHLPQPFSLLGTLRSRLVMTDQPPIYSARCVPPGLAAEPQAQGR
jgi:hypothetical protein